MSKCFYVGFVTYETSTHHYLHLHSCILHNHIRWRDFKHVYALRNIASRIFMVFRLNHICNKTFSLFKISNWPYYSYPDKQYNLYLVPESDFKIVNTKFHEMSMQTLIYDIWKALSLGIITVDIIQHKVIKGSQRVTFSILHSQEDEIKVCNWSYVIIIYLVLNLWAFKKRWSN